MSGPENPFEAALDGFPRDSSGGLGSARDGLEVLLSRFADEVRQGLRPSVEQYAIEHPHLAEEIRELFPLVGDLERWKSDKESECVRQGLPEKFPFEQLGGYRIRRELGRGGMGVVFEAEEERTQHLVAIKLLPWRFVSDLPRRRERFRREASMIARLRHRNIVPIYTFGEQEGYCFYVMQKVEGVSLDWIIRRLREAPTQVGIEEVKSGGRGIAAAGSGNGSLGTGPAVTRGLSRDSWAAFARIGIQVATGLAHAHQRGVLHNDVKPANLLLDSTGRIVITDFGAGGRLREERLENEDTLVGTLRYMAPERLLDQCDERSDVYSLGVTLYELTTLHCAFDSEDRGRLAELVLQGEAVSPRKLVPRLPAALETIIVKSMSRRPEDRYPTTKAMAADLLRFTNGQPIEAKSLSIADRIRNWYTRRAARLRGE